MLNILKKSSFFIVILVVVGLILFFKGEDSSNNNAELHAVVPAEDEQPEQQTDPVANSAMVDVKGQVKRPGVYEVDIDFRINDVIDMAGGFTKDADQTQVNLAQKVQDEMVIMIPKTGEITSVAEGSINDSSKVRINYATQEEIETLNGIGPSKAQAIIQYREEHGLFKTADDLLDISGIGEKTLENLIDDIQVP